MNKIVKSTLYALLMVFLMACTNKFEEYNTDPIGVTKDELKQDNNYIGILFPPLQQMIYCNYDWGWGTNWPFQVMQNLNADIFSGYMASATDFAGGVNNQTYSLVAGWNDSSWDYNYAYGLPNTTRIASRCQEDYETFSHFDAINKILKVMTISRLSDQYGPVIYTHFGEAKTGGTYDSAQDAYKAFFADLKEAVSILTQYTKSNPGLTPFEKFDMAYGGDYTKWIKFANTLRLRLAMRVVKYDAQWAKTEAEAAVAAGIITSNDESFTVSGLGYFNPLAAISGGWNDISISANLESILGGYNDARLAKMATGNKGMRSGIPNLSDYDYHPVVSYVNVSTSDPANLLMLAEAYFLRAEGALRAWNMGSGDAKSFYEAGVKASFEQWGASIGDYLSSDNVPADFVDQLQPAIASSPAVSKVSPKWDDAASNEVKLEKIITQKWIAGFPEGINAWAEWRRTGYPKLFPIVKNDSQGAIPTELGVRRLPFSSAEKSGNAAGYADAVQKLKGADTGATRIFWDIDKANF